jgi:hypothetical protein
MRNAARHRLSAAALGLLLVVFLAGAPVALAVFGHTATGGPQAVATGTLLSPSNLKATQVNCRVNRSPEIQLGWTATESSYASGYAIERAAASAGPYTTVGSVALGTNSYTDTSGALAYSTTYYYRVSASFHSWSAASAVASVKTLSKSCG